MTDRVARLWLDHGLAPSEIETCPPNVLARATSIINERIEAQRTELERQQFEADTARMHEQLRGH